MGGRGFYSGGEFHAQIYQKYLPKSQLLSAEKVINVADNNAKFEAMSPSETWGGVIMEQRGQISQKTNFWNLGKVYKVQNVSKYCQVNRRTENCFKNCISVKNDENYLRITL